MNEEKNKEIKGQPELEKVVEALLFASPEPLSTSRLSALVSGPDREYTRGEIDQAVAKLGEDYRLQGRAFEISRVANGYRFQSCRRYAPYIRKMFNPRRYSRLTQATLETLAIIAYKQPITKAEIESIRGVSVDGVIKTLLDRELIKVLGQKEVLGRPYLYGTGQRFLEHFGLRNLGDLPALEEGISTAPQKIGTSSDLKVKVPADEELTQEQMVMDTSCEPENVSQSEEKAGECPEQKELNKPDFTEELEKNG